MKPILLILVLLPHVVPAQNVTLPLIHQDKADEIVAFFVGDDLFQKYVKADRKKSRRITSNSFFQYNFRHPKFAPVTFVIALTLDSIGQFVPGKETQGLVRLAGSDLNWITRPQALNICRDQSHRLEKRSLRLAWDSTNVSYEVFERTKNFRDIVPGNIVWQVDGEVLFRGNRYSGTFEVDPLTGAVFRRFAIPWD
jgi:hypothetical protein